MIAMRRWCLPVLGWLLAVEVAAAPLPLGAAQSPTPLPNGALVPLAGGGSLRMIEAR